MKAQGINVIITGSTGMVGEGVLHECLNDPRIASITLLNRHSIGYTHTKVKEILLPDLFAFTGEEPGLSNADACFYCLGTTSIGKSEKEYTRITYDLSLIVAKPLIRLNPNMTFCYITAKGTDVSGKTKTMWARIKGKTENELYKIASGNFYAFRPFMLTPIKGLRNTHGFYKYISWFFPFGQLIYPAGFCTLKELAQAMIRVGIAGFDKQVVTPQDMVLLAKLK